MNGGSYGQGCLTARAYHNKMMGKAYQCNAKPKIAGFIHRKAPSNFLYFYVHTMTTGYHRKKESEHFKRKQITARVSITIFAMPFHCEGKFQFANKTLYKAHFTLGVRANVQPI